MCAVAVVAAEQAGSINLMLEPKFCRWLPIFQKSKFSKNRNFQKIEIFKKNWCWNRNFVAGYQFFKNRNFQKIKIFKKSKFSKKIDAGTEILSLASNFFKNRNFQYVDCSCCCVCGGGGVYKFDAGPLIFPLTELSLTKFRCLTRNLTIFNAGHSYLMLDTQFFSYWTPLN